MMGKKFIIILSFSIVALLQNNSNAQVQVMNDCSDPEVFGCSDGNFVFTSVGDDFDDFPAGSISANCLSTGDNQLIYFVIEFNTSGLFEWTVQGNLGTGFMDWAVWPYSLAVGGDPSTSCVSLANGTLAPLACNWNASSDGFAGMANPVPPGGDPGNFEAPIAVSAGQTVLLGISNYNGSLDGQDITLDFSGTAVVSCQPYAQDQTICEGSSTLVNIITPGLTAPEFTWLVTTGVADPSSGTNVNVTPTVTTNYEVEVFQPGGGGSPDYIDTARFTLFVVNPASPNAGLDQSVCIGSPIGLSGVISDPMNSVLWSYQTTIMPAPTVTFSPSATTVNSTVTVNQQGTYSFILTESNGVCPDVSDTMEVVVSDISITAAQVSPSCGGLADGEIHINSPDGIEYSFDNGVTWQTDSFAVGFGAGTYQVCAKNILDCQKCLAIDVVEPTPVTIIVSEDTLICQNGTAILTANAFGGTNFLYHWDNTGNTAASQSVSPSVSSVYTVFAENENGCFSTSELINVNIRPGISGSISPNDTICPGYSTQLATSVSGGLGPPYTFVWSHGVTHNGSGVHTIDVSPPQTKTYTVVISDECESTPLVLSTEVRVAPLPVPLFEVVDPEQCEPAIFQILNKTDSALCESFIWRIDNGKYEYLNQDTISTAPLFAGTYNVQLIVTSFEGCIDSTKVNLAINVHPKPDVNFGYSPNPVRMFNTNVTFINTSINAVDYQWFFDGGNPGAATSTNAYVSFPDGVASTYDITLIARSNFGCIDTIIKPLIIHPEIIVYAPNSFTPDNDEFNQNWKVFIDGIDEFDFDLKIVNRWGQLIWESHNIQEAWDGTLNGKEIPPGTYSWVIRAKDKLNDNKYTFTGHVNLLK